MARIRSIKPEFFTDELVATWPLSARLTYIGLWTYVDDEGRGADNAALVKAAVWPLDQKMTESKVDADLSLLSTAGRVCRYVEDGKRLLHIPRWKDHQRINRPTDSRLPECKSHGVLSESSVSPHGAITEASPQEGKGKEGNGGVAAPVVVKGCGFHRSKPSATCIDCGETPTPPNVHLVLAEQDRLAREA